MTTFIECSLLKEKGWGGQFTDQSLCVEPHQGQQGK